MPWRLMTSCQRSVPFIRAGEVRVRSSSTDGLASAIDQAKAAAGDKDVIVMGGGDVIRQCVDTGLLRDTLNGDEQAHDRGDACRAICRVDH
jgi:UTP-glucose-1-phosphate uridylyltransferase